MMRRLSFWCALAVCAFALTACNTLLAGGSSSTETGDKVSLSGHVTSGAGDGIAGVIVALDGTALADTTDITGSYSLAGRRVRASATDPDTLTFTLNGQTVAKRGVTTLTAAVPDIRIVPRGFSGTFAGGDTLEENTITRVEGVVTGEGISPGDSIAATFYYNTLSNTYSGFIWFPPPTSTTLNYVVHINVYGAGGMVTGRSQSVPFNSLAGNVTIPDFDPHNLNASLPRAASNDVTAANASTRSSP
jgi:predicted small secreted protein